ncbi:MAG: hypothetical protein VB111_01815 [Clostridiaceae bacterium]|nr:hypothetical protein [Clostridiaceae bacterium]
MGTVQKKRTIALLLILVALTIAVIGYIILPDRLIVQITTAGQTPTTLPKPAALGVPVVLCGIFSVAYIREEKTVKNLIIAIVMVIVMLLTLWINL